MTAPQADPGLTAILLGLQRGEITEHHIYKKIAAVQKDSRNRDVLERIAQQEIGHYAIWKQYTGQDVAPATLRIWFYYLIARVLGMTFAIKLMEGVEKRAQVFDRGLVNQVPEAREILEHEENHERDLIALIDEDRLKYVGSVVLGLNDALVEFTGTLAGLTFAIQNTQIIAIAGLIMGVAASLSMGASEYLSQQSDGGSTNPFRASLYTGATYIITVALLILPFLILASPYHALVFTLAGAILVIFLFTFYLSVAKDLPFWRRFGEMLLISLGIAAISFVIGVLIRTVLNVSI
jgi:VIT1/CCC1 family predicted Fe2+/Mn2+ transporter